MKKPLFSFLAFSLILFSTLSSQTRGESDLEEHPAYPDELLNMLLGFYVGVWDGEYQFFGPDGTLIKIVKVELSYDWKKDTTKPVLEGRAVYASKDSVSYSKSHSFIEEGRLYSIADSNDTQTLYKARLHQDSTVIAWFSKKGTDSVQTEMAETFIDTDGQNQIKSNGYEIYQKGDNSIVIEVRGRLIKRS